MLLARLPKSFEKLVVALETRDYLPLLSAALEWKLAEEDERKNTEQNA